MQPLFQVNIIRKLLISLTAFSVVWTGERFFLTSIAFLGTSNFGQGSFGFLLMLGGCAMFLQLALPITTARAWLLAAISLIVGFSLTYWVLLPAADALLASLPGLSNSGALANGFFLATLCAVLNLLPRWADYKVWGALFIVFVGALFCITVGEFFFRSHQFDGGVLWTNEQIRSFLYGLFSWCLFSIFDLQTAM